MELRINNLCKSFDRKVVLNGVEYVFEKGKIYGLLGRNGAGKTTFFNCLNDDLKPNAGEMLLDGQPLSSDDIGYVLSTPVVPDFLTGREFLKFFTDINKKKISDIKDPDYYFDMVGIKAVDRDKLLRDYSHGMKAKLQIIINIIANTKVLLLDEPLTSLDVVAAEDMKNALREQKDDTIMIFSTHIMELALTLCDEIVLLKDCKFSKISLYDDNGVKLPDEEIKDIVIDALREENGND